VINSNLGPISYSFGDIATYSLKLSIENCGQNTAYRSDLIITDRLKSRRRPIRWYRRRPPTTYRLTTILHDWHIKVHYNRSRLSKVIDLHDCHLKANKPMRLLISGQ